MCPCSGHHKRVCSSAARADSVSVSSRLSHAESSSRRRSGQPKHVPSGDDRPLAQPSGGTSVEERAVIRAHDCPVGTIMVVAAGAQPAQRIRPAEGWHGFRSDGPLRLHAVPPSVVEHCFGQRLQTDTGPLEVRHSAQRVGGHHGAPNQPETSVQLRSNPCAVPLRVTWLWCGPAQLR